jgi:1-acyl-sn-glycerol-3-phosphate acyltransferase
MGEGAGDARRGSDVTDGVSDKAPGMYSFLRWVMRTIVRIYLVGLFRVTGSELVPRRGPLIVCCNHPSTIDPPLLPAFLPRADSWSMAKSEWFVKPGWKSWLFRQYHAFPVVRHSPDRRGLSRARDILAAGGALIIYPEGTRIESGRLERAQPGAAFLARLSDAPVVPVGLVGTNRCFPKGAFWPRRAPVEIRFGTPMRIRNQRPDGRRVRNQDAADAIMLAIARLLPPDMRGAYADIEALDARLQGIFEPVAGHL